MNIGDSALPIEKANRKNEGKAMVELIDPQFILGIGQVLEMGARKYAKDNWKLSANTGDHSDFVRDRYGSLLRHACLALEGEQFDDESGLPHMYHVAANAMFIAYYDRNEKEVMLDSHGEEIPYGI